jgi:hypothetical protein
MSIVPASVGQYLLALVSIWPCFTSFIAYSAAVPLQRFPVQRRVPGNEKKPYGFFHGREV